MEIHKLRGVVIRTYPYRDSDLIVRALTDSGQKVGLIGRAARKGSRRFQGKFDLFDWGDFSLSNSRGSLKNIQSFKPQKAFERIRADLDKISAGSFICELADFLIEEGTSEEPSVYTHFVSTLSDLDHAESLNEVLRATYFGSANILSDLGLLDLQTLAAPGAAGLMKLIDITEDQAERQLSSKKSLLATVERLRKG